MNNTAMKRLASEFKDIQKNPLEGIEAEPTDDLFEWKVLIKGPPETCYEKGYFKANLSFPRNYPFCPPKLKFTQKMFHPNIYSNGDICISILHPRMESTRNGSGIEGWGPAQTIKGVLISVRSLLSDPNPDSAANFEASQLWINDREKFEKRVKNMIEKQK